MRNLSPKSLMASTLLPWMGFTPLKTFNFAKNKVGRIKAAKKYKDHVRPETRAAWNRMRQEEVVNPPAPSRQVRRRIERPWKHAA